MTWNCRVVRFKSEITRAKTEHDDYETGEYYEIKEVFYNANGKPIGYSDAVCGSDTYEGLFKSMAIINAAHTKPVLDESEFYSVEELRIKKQLELWNDDDEARINIIGQNGNDGDHYE